jgi:excinuclease ABC subunit C
MVCLVEGLPSKTHYRRYKIRSVQKADDIAAMREVLMRRYRRAVKEENFPDLIVVDGGRSQLNAAHQVLNDLGLTQIPHIGLVKPEGRSEIYTPPRIITMDDESDITLSQDSAALHLIQVLRDEAHRFANAYHQKLREKHQIISELDSIPGIGKIRKQKLLQFFGSVTEIRNQPEPKIAEIIGPATAHIIMDYFETHPLIDSPPPVENGPKKLKITRKKVK